MSYRALVNICLNLNIDFLSNFQSLIETLDFLCHISMFRAGDFLTSLVVCPATVLSVCE